MTKKYFMLVLCAGTVFAQDAKPKAAPVVPVELRERFFKAQSEYRASAADAQQATQAAQAKNSALQSEIEKLKSACGANFNPNLDKDGEIVCESVGKTPEVPKK
jgi:hypothetical protein